MASTSHNPTSPPTLWDAFLSFRGKDTRFSFTHHLYKILQRYGIRTFRDDPELHSGEAISSALPRAIHESKTYIVVFSENYATSSWCLGELEDILACYTRMGRLVIPVFYHIDPSVVRHQTASFQEAFEKHRTRFDLEKVNKWRLTLKEVADFSGFHVSKNSFEADVIDKIIETVLDRINPITLDVAKYPVGLESRVKGVTELFNSDAKGVIRIGIYGMGGVGKTTLAKAVYNQNYRRFSGSCFLANVREVSRTKGLACLQQQLVNDVLKPNKKIEIDNVDQGIEVIRARICSITVLVVIDDLDDPEALRYLEGSFAAVSMVIVTTRNEDLLDRIEVKAKYKVDVMDKDESRQLFTQHAFGEDKISDAFTKLSKEIIELVGGLPLALKNSGSALFKQSEERWGQFIERWKQELQENGESCNSLKRLPNLSNSKHLKRLDFKKCSGLKEIQGSEELTHLQELVLMNCGDLLSISELLPNLKSVTAESCTYLKRFGNLSNLKHLKRLDLKKISGLIEIQGLEELTHLQELVLMECGDLLFISELPPNLKSVTAESCTIKRLPNLSNLKHLKRLDLKKCSGLIEIHGLEELTHLQELVIIDCGDLLSISELPPNMKPVTAESCTYLKRLPNLSNLKHLKRLDLRRCCGLIEIQGLEELTHLQELVLMDCGDLLSISELPPNMKSVTAECCTCLKRLPNLSNLKHLKRLDIRRCCGLIEIQGLEELTHLQELVLIDCGDLLSIS